MHPSELKIIAFECQASVIFGVGKEKYRTELVKGNNPTWNEEGVINVSNPNASLVLTVMDREESLGNITLPVINLPSAAHKRRWLPLKRKHQQTSSDLCFDCWITQFKKDKIWNKFNPFSSSVPSPQEKRRESVASASTGVRGSTSALDLYSKTLEEDEHESRNERASENEGGLSSTGRSSSSTDLTTGSAPVPPQEAAITVRPNMLPSLGAVMSMKGPPEITGISPRFGASSGGTKITIRGCNLGNNTGDFLGFSICSGDHLDSLEYHSPAKLVCTTLPWDGRKPNPGPVVLVTKSGGRGVSTIKFEFHGEPVLAKMNTLTAKTGKENSKKERKTSKNESPVELENLRRNVQDLRSENQSLRSYIDKLMVVLMEKYPDVLEATISNDIGNS